MPKVKSSLHLSIRHQQRIKSHERKDFMRMLQFKDLTSHTIQNKKNDSKSIVSSLAQCKVSEKQATELKDSSGSLVETPDSNGIIEDVPKIFFSSETSFRNTPSNTLNDSDIIIELKDMSKSDIGKLLQQDLAKWYSKYNVKLNAFDALNVILHKYNPEYELTLSAKRLLKTPRHTDVIDMAPGEYFHFGISHGIIEYLKEIGDYSKEEIHIQVGIDGFPITSEKECWPIMGRVIDSTNVFLIGMYYGETKPASSNEYLSYFVDDAITLATEGLQYGDSNYKIFVDSLVCDAPAKSFVLNTKGHTGYSSCSKCTVVGKHKLGRVTFLDSNATKRTDEGMKNMEYDGPLDYQWRESILGKLPRFGLVSKVPLDYMHLICIGLIKKLLEQMMTGPTSVRVLYSNSIATVNEYLSLVKPFIPSDFVRTPRKIEKYYKWKATECRLFSLYIGPVILSLLVDWEHGIMINFLSLFVVLRILFTSTDPAKLEFAQSCAQYFIETFKHTYGIPYVSHNVHGVNHLVDDVKEHGSLECFSAFCFENFIRHIKSKVRKPDKPLQQLHNRYVELKNSSYDLQAEKKQKKKNEQSCHGNGPLVLGTKNPQYSEFYFETFFLSTSPPDNFCKIGDDIISIHNFATMKNVGIFIIGKKFLKKRDLFVKPCASSALDIYCLSEYSSLSTWPIKQVCGKYMVIPLKKDSSTFVGLPLLHIN